MRSGPARAVLCFVVAVVATVLGRPPLPVAAGITAAPVLLGPDDGVTVSSLAPTLTWSNPAGTTQYQIQVIPTNNDGPAVDLHMGNSGTSFQVPLPPQWYGLLPDMTYRWRVRVSDAPAFVEPTDPSWGPWAERTFRTPAVLPSIITPLTPADGDTVSTLTPVLQWDSSRPDVVYYEVEVSADRAFTTDPVRASAPVYGALLHAGLTSPVRSYAIPAGAPLADNTTYYWRVRPRVQGDRAPLPWSDTYSFKTRQGAPRSLTVQEANFGAVRADGACQISQPATTFAASPSLTGLNYAYRYSGSGTVAHNWYVNDQPASDVERTLAPGSTCQTSTFGRPGGGPADGAPLPPGTYRLEVWAAGERIRSASFTVTPPAGLLIGPVTAGTSISNVDGCVLAGSAESFPKTTPSLYFRFNYVGAGDYRVAVARDHTVIAESTGSVPGPAGCRILPYLPGSFLPGSYEVAISAAEGAQQSASFAIAP